MKKRLVLATFLLLFVWIPLQVSGQSEEVSTSAQPLPTDQLIVKFQEGIEITGTSAPQQPDWLALLNRTAEVELTYVRPLSGDAHVLRLPSKRPFAEVQTIATSLATLDIVLYAEPDAILTTGDRELNAEKRLVIPRLAPDLTPNDTLYNQQWHYRYTAGTSEGVNLEPAWDISTGSASTVVAVLDTGILNHADLAGRTVAGYDMIIDTAVSNDGDGRDADPSDPGDWTELNECYPGSPPSDSSWHGTHVAGTIGAATNNMAGVAGVNWQAKVQAVRVLGTCGGYTSDIADGIRWAAGLSVAGVPANATPAKVLNLSLGGPGACDVTSQSAIDAAVGAGATVVVAAGNSNADASGFNPANCNNVVTVASVDRSGDKAYYSNFGSVVEVSAPGGETNSLSSDGVLSTLNTGTTTPGADAYVFYQGTSMAAPHVAGVASLILALRPGFAPDDVLSTLQTTARVFPGGSGCNAFICGTGIVDANAALVSLDVTFTDFVFLPIVQHAEPPPPPPSSIPNGNFESGHAAWSEYSSSGFPVIYGGSDYPITPHSGSWGAWLGGAFDDNSHIQQLVTVSSANPYMAFWHWIVSEDFCGYDFGYIRINGVAIATYNLCTSNNTGNWVKVVLNLTSYAGQSVTLQAQGTTDESLNSNWFLDDFAFQTTPDIGDSPPPTYVPTGLTKTK